MPHALDDEDKKRTFGPEQEKAIISLIFDEPDFFANILQYLTPEHFEEFAAKYVFTLIHMYYNEHGVVITRGLCKDEIENQLTVDDDFSPILELIDRTSDPREVLIIRKHLVDWAREKAYEELYSTEAYESFQNGEYSVINELIDKANRITDSAMSGYWFFDQTDELFTENNEIKLTTGFKRLDAIINEGGPTFGDAFCWMAPTGVGKSIMLVNSAVANMKLGYDVLHITCELSELKTALRYMGVMSERPIKKRVNQRDKIMKNITKFVNSFGSQLVIYEFPPDDISIDTIRAVMESLRTQHNFRPKVVIIDYMELIISRLQAYNTKGDEYAKQKKVSTEIRQLAKKENVLVFTASQTNRSGTDSDKGEAVIGLNKVAESYGKTMPLDYIVTINQTQEEYNSGRTDEEDLTSPNINAACRFFVAKNRNGAKFQTVSAKINYETFHVREADIL